MNAMERASEATSADQANELAGRVNEQTDELPAKHLRRDTWCSLLVMRVGKCEKGTVVDRGKKGVLLSSRWN